MGYDVIQFNSGAPPGISAERLMHIQTQFAEALAELAKISGASIVGVQPVPGIEGGTVQAVLDALALLIAAVGTAGTSTQQDLDIHKADTMPHKFTDGTTTYRWGLAVIDGVVNMVYEEVV